MGKHIVAMLAEIPPGKRKIIQVAGRSIGVFNIDGEFFALRNRCPHQGGPLCKGRLLGVLQSTIPGDYNYSRPDEMLQCPWHGWEFDIRTGQSWFDPTRLHVRRYPVTIETETEISASGTNLTKGPFVAETYPVSVEEERFIVVEITS